MTQTKVENLPIRAEKCDQAVLFKDTCGLQFCLKLSEFPEHFIKVFRAVYEKTAFLCDFLHRKKSTLKTGLATLKPVLIKITSFVTSSVMCTESSLMTQCVFSGWTHLTANSYV